jgi:putative salt-induced outer membrane protein
MSTVAGGAVIALLLGASASMAQGVLTGTDALDDRIDDIEQNVQDDFGNSEDSSRFGNPEYRPGLSGSASLGYSGKTGNNESQEFSAGARLRFAQGQLVQTIAVALDFADDNGVKTKEDVFGVYDANYYFDDRFYGFVLGRVESDGLATLATDVKTDAFIGFGPGYRIVNTPDMTWRVQAGIGVSYLEDGLDNSETETGYILSSRFFYSFNENVFATNDTDILKSDSALRVNNDLGVNFKMTDAFSTRVSYLTEYNDSRAIRTDNKLGVSLVYGF